MSRSTTSLAPPYTLQLTFAAVGEHLAMSERHVKMHLQVNSLLFPPVDMPHKVPAKNRSPLFWHHVSLSHSIYPSRERLAAQDCLLLFHAKSGEFLDSAPSISYIVRRTSF